MIAVMGHLPLQHVDMVRCTHELIVVRIRHKRLPQNLENADCSIRLLDSIWEQLQLKFRATRAIQDSQ